VVVTGAAGGIGKELVRQVANDGASLVLVDMNEQALTNLVTELGIPSERALTVRADVSKEEEVKNYVNQAVSKFDKIDAFFNNAGVEGTHANVEDYDTSVFDFVFNVNVRGVFLGLKYVVPVMKKQGYGSIVNSASLAGSMGSPGFAAYNSSKHAVIGLTRVVAAEVTPHNIRVNAIAPGVINTQMMRKIEENAAPGAAKEAEKAFQNSVPMGRYGEASEVANVVYFLLSDAASYVSHSIYTVDGGMLGQ